MFSLVAANLQVWRHACNWQSCQVVSFMKKLFLEDELKYFFLNFSWDVCLFTLVKPIIMGGCGFHFAMTLIFLSYYYNSIQFNRADHSVSLLWIVPNLFVLALTQGLLKCWQHLRNVNINSYSTRSLLLDLKYIHINDSDAMKLTSDQGNDSDAMELTSDQGNDSDAMELTSDQGKELILCFADLL